MTNTAEDSFADMSFDPERSTGGQTEGQTEQNAAEPLLPLPVSARVEPGGDGTTREPLDGAPYQEGDARHEVFARSSEDLASAAEAREYLTHLDTSSLPAGVRDTVEEYRRAALVEIDTNILARSPTARDHGERQPDQKRVPDHLPLEIDPGNSGVQDTGALRATLAAEQARYMGAGELSEHTRHAIREYARRQSGAPALDTDATVTLSQQLREAGLPEEIREAIIEFAAGPRGVTGAPYFTPESDKLDTGARDVVMALRSHMGPDKRWWRRALGVVMEPATLVIALFAAAQVWLVLGQRTGPFLDEAIYIDAGIRALQGFGISDNYLTWFAGSLLWPVVASFGYLAGGLVGARLIAVVCTTVAGLATASASRNLFGRTAGRFAAIAFALCGPVIHLAHLAVYDQIALAGVALSFWAITRAALTYQRVWLVVAAIALGVGALSKYPMIACLIPLIGVLIALRARQVFADLFILVFVIAAMLLGYVLPARDQLVALLIWRTRNNPSFGVTTAMVRYGLLYYGLVIWGLALVGWLVARRQRRLATTLVGGLLLWPVYHVLIDNSVGAEKHIVFGFVFGLPLVGVVFASLWRQGGQLRWLGRMVTLLSVLALAVIGVSQAQTLDAGWADTRPAAAYLLEHAQPGETLLISNAAPYQMELYIHGKITSPWDVYDTYRVQHNQLTTPICAADWYVDEEGGNGWPLAIRQEIMACGTFKEVFVSESTVTQLGSDLDFVTYPVRTTVWVNIAKH